MGLARSIRRQKHKAAKKQVEKQMSAIMQTLAMMPDACNVCEAPFDKRNPAMMQEWRIEVGETQDMKITCLKCQAAEVENELK